MSVVFRSTPSQYICFISMPPGQRAISGLLLVELFDRRERVDLTLVATVGDDPEHAVVALDFRQPHEALVRVLTLDVICARYGCRGRLRRDARADERSNRWERGS